MIMITDCNIYWCYSHNILFYFIGTYLFKVSLSLFLSALHLFIHFCFFKSIQSFICLFILCNLFTKLFIYSLIHSFLISHFLLISQCIHSFIDNLLPSFISSSVIHFSSFVLFFHYHCRGIASQAWWELNSKQIHF